MTENRSWIYDILLVAVIAVAAFLRVTGVEWGEGQHQHPDELFLSGVVDNLRAHTCMDEGTPIEVCPPDRQRWMNPLEYFNTAESTLNPRNRGAGFYVYGNLPITLVRVSYELLGEKAGPLKYFGRQFSALADIVTLIILYFLVARLYNRKTALLATAFSALAVMQIQQSHYFTVDLFMNPFMYAALYFAVRIAYDGTQESASTEIPNSQFQTSNLYSISRILRDPIFHHSLLFGLFLGMAAASKINAVVMAVVLPIALWIRFSHRSQNEQGDSQPTPNSYLLTPNSYHVSFIITYLVIGGLATILSFRVFQPYAFDGLMPSEQWIANMKEIQAQATGLADLPWNLQWARRTHLFSFTNLTVWGLGLPLGILAWTGFLVMGWRIFKNREHQHIVLWSWTALYFAWQSMQFNATMRYQLPIYPLLCMMAAWLVFNGIRKVETENEFLVSNFHRLIRNLLYFLGTVVLALTAVYAFAFLSVYTRDETRMAASRWIYQNVPGPITVQFTDGTAQPLPFPIGAIIQNDLPHVATFSAASSGTLDRVVLPHVVVSVPAADAGTPATNPFGPQTVTLSLLNAADPTVTLAALSATVNYPNSDPRGDEMVFTFEKPIAIERGQIYSIRIETAGTITLAGSNISNETDYDWSLPFRVDGYDAFGGLYPGDLNLQVYWDDNTEKLARFQSILNQTDYIFIPTNHQYGQITRIPERYPLTTHYYRELIGCPAEKDIIWCYRVAEPGMFEGRLGFDLVKTFASHPTLGPIVINDQAAEEAFTFYDHPKVLIFKKNADYNAAQVAYSLGQVDLTKVVRLTPKDAGDYEPPKSLMLPTDRLAQQQAGGTWSDLFSYDTLQNKYPYLGLVIWYVFIFLLGLFTYPLARRALPGLADKGYALSRILGLVLLAYLSWMAGSLGLTYSRANIAVALGLIALVGAWQAWVQRDAIRAEWKSNRRLFIIAEIVFLCLFLLDLFIRLGNPDLWHPAKGGERPMDFSYFNAVLKSTSFPPYDPWFAGGYINYYYYGFVIVGTPVKLLGIVPSIAYNFILPTLFALVGTGAFVVGFNLVESQRSKVEETRPSTFDLRFITGISATFLTLLLGNLGTIQMLWRAFQRMAAPGGVVPVDTGFFQRLMWGLDGFAKSLAGIPLPLGQGDWYWLPSRVIPAPGDIEPITEFPLFTFLYSDLHAHMIVLPLALFVIAWGLSFVVAMRSANTQPTSILHLLSRIFTPIIFGALVLGAVYPTNTWDAFTYFPLAAIAVGYAVFIAVDIKDERFKLPPFWLKLGAGIWAAITLVILARVFYQPYFHWFGTGYGDIDPWKGTHTPLTSYFTHWGVFLFLIFAWMAWETREWMASTPLSSLGKLKPYQLLIEGVIAAFVVMLIYLIYREAVIALIALPLALWAAILILRPDQTDAKRWVLFMIGTSLALTVAVEIIVLVGDIGRMNTVFKLYLQAWTMLSVSAAAALGWVLPAVPLWTMRWRGVWQVGITLLLAGAAFFTMSATMDKIRDRMNPEVPHVLDSMEYMRTSQFWDSVTMDLGQDYRAIRWMQENVQGSPAIIEANCVEYRWCTRFTIYTGLPGVVGWNWHQRQQRGFVQPMLVENRISEITNFYTTINPLDAVTFLKKYNIRYIIVGQVESVYYPGEGLLKFDRFNGVYWTEVYRDGQTVIYEVNK